MTETIHSTSETYLFHSIQRFVIPHGEPSHQPLHRHPDTAELLLVTEGCVRCKIGTQSYSLPSGTALFVPSGSWHEMEYPAVPKQRGYRLSFTPPHLKSALMADVPQVIHVDDLAGIIPLFARLQQENAQPHPDSRITHHLVGLILALLERSTDTQNSIDGEKTIRLVKIYMEEHHCRSLSLDDLAVQFAMNKYQLARLFKQHTGMSPLQYLITCRIHTAKQLLATTETAVASIGSRVGYKSATQFQAAFKKAVGITPRLYRLDSTKES
ncbi:helix-turn-helix transcriptional regulator [Planococcus sp. 4-30]|uniref:helix-turn-helix transcriptional regulator n=1 Tax=Planococcus sp. 4-30 TaxID=2874583 RepID=UPI001CBDECA3|nr:AraC family transcriptional regulator [Planococcus sp. 4-30]